VSDSEIRPGADRDRAQGAGTEPAGVPFVSYRDGSGREQTLALRAGGGAVTIGRREDNDVALPWDPNVSRVHAQLEPVGGEWAIVDDGLSRNGTKLNGRTLAGRHRLHDQDLITVGLTRLLYRSPPDPSSSTAAGRHEPPPPHLTETQRRVLVALCRPCLETEVMAPPASNRQIADEVFSSVDAVKAHLRSLFAKFDIGDLPHNQKRTKLVGEALRRGAVTADIMELYS